jgi:hypothetical protein
VQTVPSLRLTAALNALAGETVLSGEMWVRSVVGQDVAHHVVDPDDLLGLDSEHAEPLGDALPRLVEREPAHWVLSLPIPGGLSGLRGPKQLNLAAIEQGEAIIAVTAGIALVPYRVGPAIQWRLFPAEPPLLPPGPYDAERELSEAVLRAADTLQHLDVAGGDRPADPALRLPTIYPNRQRLAADRAARLLVACEAALTDDGNALSSYEAEVRSRELRAVRDCARTALCAAVTWRRTPDETPIRDHGTVRGAGLIHPS